MDMCHFATSNEDRSQNATHVYMHLSISHSSNHASITLQAKKFSQRLINKHDAGTKQVHG